MTCCSAALLLALLPAATSMGSPSTASARFHPAPDYGAAMALLAAEDYRGALAALESEPDPILRLDGEAELYFKASDPAGALGAAEAGLALDPEHLNLRFRAAASALWLGAGQRAMDHSKALGRALERASLSEDQRDLWRQAVADYTQEAQALITLESDRARALLHARTVAWIGLIGLGLALVWALLAPQSAKRDSAAAT